MVLRNEGMKGEGRKTEGSIGKGGETKKRGGKMVVGRNRMEDMSLERTEKEKGVGDKRVETEEEGMEGV